MQLGAEGRPYVPVQINDTSKAMLVDTGGFFTGITQEAADKLKLSLRHSHAQFIGLSGDESSGVARASLKLGNLTADGMDLIILPGIHGLGSDDAVGVIGANLLRSYDLDLDMGGKKINLISQKHCDGKVVYWPNNGVAVIPIRVNAVGHIFVPVQLDGHSLQAMLDTGADGSTLTLPVAQATFGITPGDNSTPMAKEPLNGKVTAYTHRFKSLSLEGIAISNPTLALIPDMMRKMDPHDSIEGDTRIRDPNSDVGTPDVILGMDILRRLHVYIAYKEKKLYITPAAVPAATASVSANSAASASK
jgi:predicted aspartyl protease